MKKQLEKGNAQLERMQAEKAELALTVQQLFALIIFLKSQSATKSDIEEFLKVMKGNVTDV